MSTLTSTTAPGKVFESRAALAEHYKSDWHKYNLKRREAGLPLLREEDFQARWEAALALRREREQREERSGTSHLKNKKKKGKKLGGSSNSKQKGEKLGGNGVVAVSQAAAYDRIKSEAAQAASAETTEEEPTSNEHHMEVEEEEIEEEPPVIEPRQCLFDKHLSATVALNIERMNRKYGFFIPDQEFLVDPIGLIGYCHEKIKLGHCCLYCQRLFRTWEGCQKHMVSTRHTKLRYERGIDLDEFDPFYDFSEADAEFLGALSQKKHKESKEMDYEEVVDGDDDDIDSDEWEDVTDEEDMEDEDVETEDDDLYAGYEEEIARFGFDVSPLGELVFPDGRIIGHRGLSRYYKQRYTHHHEDRTAIVAARRAAGERLYNGRVYSVNNDNDSNQETTLSLARAGVAPATAAGRAGKGILVQSAGGGGFTALSLYRYKAVVNKARRDEARGQRLENRTKQNINKMDKKHNRLNNGVSVAHAPR